MRIQSESGDADEFIGIVELIAGDLIRKEEPRSLISIKTDNWFGPNWLGFSGKALGATGVWNDTLTVPPFVPARIVSQRKFASPGYEQEDGVKAINLRVPSDTALRRGISEVAAGVLVLWYSGRSAENGRGSIMAYVPQGEQHGGWYAGWAKRASWG